MGQIDKSSIKNTRYIFLDRDGVINEDPHTPSTYVTTWNEFHFLPHVKSALQKLTRAGYSIFIVSNQAGVAKGFYTQKDLDDITRRMTEEIQQEGGRIAGVFYCPHQNKDLCECRKPKAGLFTQIEEREKTSIDFSKYYFIGDTERDVKTARAAGLKSLLILSGKTKTAQEAMQFTERPDVIKRDLAEAVEWILIQDGIISL